MTTPQFADYELSQKLHELGCKSESQFYYAKLKEEQTDVISTWYDVGYSGGLVLKRVGPYLLADGMNVFNPDRDFIFYTKAFSLLDFIGPYEHAIENCRKVFGDRDVEYTVGEFIEACDFYRERILHTPPDENAWKIIEDALK